jgi:hypothetical protein
VPRHMFFPGRVKLLQDRHRKGKHCIPKCSAWPGRSACRGETVSAKTLLEARLLAEMGGSDNAFTISRLHYLVL